MKKTISILFLILGILSLPKHINASQDKITWDDDTVKINGVPYALLKKKNVGPMRNDFAVSSLSGTELIYFKSMLRDWDGSGFKFGAHEELYYEATFISTGSSAYLKHYTGNGFAKLIVENNLIKANIADPESEKRFIKLNHGTMPSNNKAEERPVNPAVVVNINNSNGSTSDNNSTVTSTPPSPKSKSPVAISGNQISRDEMVIGKFRQDTTSSSYSQKTIVITIYSESGEKVAEASTPLVNPQEWNIKTISDSKTFNILYDQPNEREKLFKWLADKNYLSN